MPNPTQEEIRARAHQLWKLAGEPEGREEEFWHEAERELNQSDVANNPDEKSDTFLE